jgi:hypothetical protein
MQELRVTSDKGDTAPPGRSLQICVACGRPLPCEAVTRIVRSSRTPRSLLRSLETSPKSMIAALLAGQLFVVLFIALHAWIPLGRLSNPAGIGAADSAAKLIRVTVLSTLPFAVAFVASAYFAGTRFPGWLMWTLWISYGLGF